MWGISLALLCMGTSQAVFFEDTFQSMTEFAWVVTMNMTRSNVSRFMPDNIHLELHTLWGAVDLPLNASRANTVRMPVYRVQEAGGNYLTTVTEPDIENCEIYQNVEYKASIVCRELESGEQFDIMGSFTHNGQWYRVQPAKLYENSTTRIHVVRPMDNLPLNATDVLKYRIAEIEGTSTFTDADTNPATASALQSYKIEVAFFTDYKDYKNFQETFGLTTDTDTVEMMAMWYSTISEFITLTYSTVGEDNQDIDIVVQVIGLHIAKTPNESRWSEDNVRAENSNTVDASSTIADFKEYRTTLIAQNKILRADHAIAITGYDLWRSGNGVVGIAYVGTMCNDFSISLIENGFRSWEGKIASHELGHSFGANHDGNMNDCMLTDFYMMAATLRLPSNLPESKLSNSYRFSPCSISKFASSLSSFTCTQQDISNDDINLGASGQIFNADTQCLLFTDGESKFCRHETFLSESSFDSMCLKLLCQNPRNPSSCQEYFPLQKTTCGDGKWCENGHCVVNQDAPSTIAGCPQGDDRTFGCVAGDCDGYSDDVKSVFCCETCDTASKSSTTTSSTTTTTSTTKPITTTTDSPTTSTTTLSSTATTTTTTIQPTTSTTTTSPPTTSTTTTSPPTTSTTTTSPPTTSTTTTSPPTTSTTTTSPPTTSTTTTSPPTTSTTTTSPPTTSTTTTSPPTTSTTTTSPQTTSTTTTSPPTTSTTTTSPPTTSITTTSPPTTSTTTTSPPTTSTTTTSPPTTSTTTTSPPTISTTTTSPPTTSTTTTSPPTTSTTTTSSPTTSTTTTSTPTTSTTTTSPPTTSTPSTVQPSTSTTTTIQPTTSTTTSSTTTTATSKPHTTSTVTATTSTASTTERKSPCKKRLIFDRFKFEGYPHRRRSSLYDTLMRIGRQFY